MALIDTIALVATVLTIFSFLTGLLICRSIYRIKSTKDFSSFTFLAGVLCTYLWLRYGLILNDSTMIFVNSIGFFLQAFYLTWFYLYTASKSQINRRVAALVSFLFLVHLYSRYWSEPDLLIGSMACVSSLLFCASPLASVSDVVRTRSSEKLPFSLILSSFLVSMMWFTYGYLLGDNFVQFPNAIGALITAIQLSLFVIYPSKRHVE